MGLLSLIGLVASVAVEGLARLLTLPFAAFGDEQGKSGHRGQLVCTQGPTAITGVEGCTWNPGINTAEWGGYGHTSRRAAATMPGPTSVTVDGVPWDDSDTYLNDLLDAMLDGTIYTFYWYPRGAVDQTKYRYGEFMFSDLPHEGSIDDVIRQPFDLVQAGEIYRVGM